MDAGSITHLIIEYRYWILFPLACFEGPLIAFVVGTLVALGYFNVFFAYLLLVLGDVIPDTGYYLLGRYGEKGTLTRKYLSKMGVTEDHFDVVRNLWNAHTGKTMFFSKLAYGLSTPFLISAGLIGMKLKTFLRYALPVTFAQYAILLALGYFFGASYYETITQSFNGIGLIIVAVVVVAVAYYFFTKFMRSKLLTIEKKEEQKEQKEKQKQK